MERQEVALSTHHFSVESIPELVNKLTSVQKRLFDEIWNRYVAFGNSFPLRSIPQIIGKQSVKEAFEGLNGSLIYETTEQDGRYFKLTIYGALLTVHGLVLFSLLVRLLDLVKDLCENDSFLKELNKDQIKVRLNLSDAEIQILFKILNLGLPARMPIYLSSSASDGSEWTIAITDEVIELLRADETAAYLNDRLSGGYRPEEPYLYSERLRYQPQIEHVAVLNPRHDLPFNLTGANPSLTPSKEGWPTSFDTAFETYKVVGSHIGEGGAGRVYSVKNESNEQFALKCLSPERITSDRRKRFKNEISFCSRYEHRNIIQVLDSGLSIIKGEKCPFYVMPEFPMTLRKLLDQGISSESALHLFSQILDGIDAAHKLKAFHRDLKPENILYDPITNLAVIADFGIAHFEEDIIATLVKTKAGAKMANFGYSAPEQRIKGAKVDHRADIFALGLILNEMFTGAVPHGAGYKFIASVAPEFAYLDSLVEQMIQNVPDARPDSIDTIKSELIARGNAFVALQRVDEITNEVVPKFEAGKFEPIKIISPDWDDERLILELNRAPETEWVQRFKQPNSGGWNFVPRSGPESFQFFGKKAIVGADEQAAQQIVDYAKSYVEMANLGYQRDLDLKAIKEEQEFREKLLQEQVAAETKARVISKLKL